eukprot:1142638-Pelagomonas_calceolata.AAC.1
MRASMLSILGALLTVEMQLHCNAANGGRFPVFQYCNKDYKGKRPQSRRLTASLFIGAHEIMKEKREVHLLTLS